MDTKPAGSGEKEDPILISDYEEGFSDQSQLENLLKQLDSITRDISDLTIESPDHQKIYREGNHSISKTHPRIC